MFHITDTISAFSNAADVRSYTSYISQSLIAYFIDIKLVGYLVLAKSGLECTK